MKNKILKSLCVLGSGVLLFSCNDGKNNSSVSSTDTSTTTMSSPAARDNAATTGMDTTTMKSNTNSGGTTGMKSDNMNSGGTATASNEFVSKAADGGMMEVELGKVAQANAGSAAVKEYGKMLETDHSKANAELKSIAASENISVPASMSEMHNMHVKDLSAKKGADFDKAYITMMVEDHNKDIAEFKTAAKENSNSKVKAFATKTLPTLEAHLAKAKALKAKM